MRIIYIGMDMHKNYIYAVGLDREGNKQIEQRFSDTELETFLDAVGPDIEVAIESTTSAGYAYTKQ